MIEPYQKDDQLISDILSSKDDHSQIRVWWLGQSGFLVQAKGKHLLFDPYLSDSLTTKYAATDKPHVRMTELVVDPARLDFVDVVTSSHNHTDHLDAETLVPMMESNADLQVLVPAANVEFAAERLKVAPTRLAILSETKPFEAAGFRLTAVPAAHETIERDDQGNPKCIGVVCECDDFVIYHSGDTIRYDEQVSILSNWDIDLAILPINGRAPERRVSGNLFGEEAADLANELNAGCVIPCHYEMFEFNTASPKAFVDRCQSLGQNFTVLRCGEAWRSK